MVFVKPLLYLVKHPKAGIVRLLDKLTAPLVDQVYKLVLQILYLGVVEVNTSSMMIKKEEKSCKPALVQKQKSK